MLRADSRLPPFHRACGVVLCTSVPLCAVAYSLDVVSFLHVKQAVLVIGLLLVAALNLGRPVGLLPGLRAFLPLWLLLGFCAIVHIGMGRAPVQSYAIEEFIRLLTLLLFASFAYAFLAEETWRNRFFVCIEISAVLVAGLALSQYFGLLPGPFPVFPGYDQRMYSVFGNQDLLGGYVAMAIPLSAHVYSASPRWRPLRLASLALLATVLLLSGSRSAWLACFIGIALLLVMHRTRLRVFRTPALCAVLLAILLCVLVPEATVDRVTRTFRADDVGGRARLWFWAGAVESFKISPLVGYGLGNYQWMSTYVQGEVLRKPGGEHYYHNELQTLHPHSDPLEIQAEMGLVGTLLVLWMFWSLRKTRGPEWAPLTVLVAFSLFNPTYSSAPHALAGLLFMASLKARSQVLVPPDEDSPAALEVTAASAAAFAALLCAAFTLRFVLYPSYLLRKAEIAMQEGRPPDEYFARLFDKEQKSIPIRVFAELFDYPWPNYEAHEKWGGVLLERGKNDAALDEFTHASIGIHTGRLEFFTGLAEERNGNLRDAASMYQRTLRLWPFDQVTWSRLVPLLTPQEREELRPEAKRWLSPEAYDALFPSADGL